MPFKNQNTLTFRLMPQIDSQSPMVFALKLIGMRSHSRKELERKLLKKGYGKEIIDNVLEKLTREGVLDDRIFGMELIRSRSRRKPSGKLKLHCELRNKGVPENLIAELLDEYDNQEPCRLAAEKKFASLRGATETDRKKKLEVFLRNRGFEWREIQPVIRFFFHTGPDSENPC